VNLGVGFAAFLFVALCVGMVVLMMAWRRERGSHVVIQRSDGIVPGLAYASIDLPDDFPGHPEQVSQRVVGSGHPAGTARVGNKALPSPRIVIDGVVLTPGAPPPPVGVNGQKALVVSDVVPVTSGIAAAITRLHDAGFVVLGNYPGNTAGAEESREQDELAASARAIRNLAPLSAPDTSELLSIWVADQPDLSLLVWFTKPDPEKSAVQAYVFSPWHDPNKGEGVPPSERTTLQSALGALRSN
jgi:hypothetical protein